jgi:hypothetical protein
MSDHKHTHTELLKHCLRYDDSSQRHELEKDLTRMQREVHCVQKAVWLMGILAALAVAGLAYPTLLLKDLPHSTQRLIMSLMFALFLGSLISLGAFLVLGVVYRRKLRKQREVCSHMVKRVLAERFGEGSNSPTTILPEDSRIRVGPKTSGAPGPQPERA